MAVTKSSQVRPRQPALSLALIILLLVAALSSAFSVSAAVLPEERADVMYHRYQGGGMVIDGPSFLVRKNIGDNVSIAANYYVDKVSSASIDVLTQGASRYAEERTEYSLDTTYLIDKTQVNIGYTNSSENDYEADSGRLDISHAFFSEMTTVSMGLSLGNDDISSSRDDTFERELERRNYRFGASQILTKSLLLNLNYESIVDEGYLQNPYRKIIETTCNVSAADLQSCPVGSRSASLEDETYPRTRNSDAFSVKLSLHLPWNAALKARVGYFNDSWGIESGSLALDYTQRLGERLVFDVRARGYTQGQADFYANQHYASGATTPDFRARDKELSEHQSLSFGAGVSYRVELNGWFESIELNGQFDYFLFDYDNFLEYSEAVNPSTNVLGADPYAFNAYALRLFTTIRY